MKGIDFIICGLEHTGTTLVSELFRQIPECDSGFECGVLLAESPSLFKHQQPFYRNLKAGWGLKDKNLEDACKEEEFSGFYDLIYENSTLFENKPYIRFDKTPRYISELENILNKLNIPVVATCKSIQSIVWSDYKRSKFIGNDDIKGFLDSYVKSKKVYLKKVFKGYEFAKSSKLCKLIHLEDLCFNAYEESMNIFNHCNQVFKKEYFVLKNKRFKNTRGKSIDISLGTEHLVNSPKIFQERIQEEFCDIIESWPRPNYLNKFI